MRNNMTKVYKTPAGYVINIDGVPYFANNIQPTKKGAHHKIRADFSRMPDFIHISAFKERDLYSTLISILEKEVTIND
jgi:hypothetical protein